METAQALIEQKTRELCEAIVQHPEFSEMFRKLDAFMTDELVKFEFQMVNDRAQLLQQKQSAGLPITPEEISDFEALRDSVLSKPVAAEFLVAQDQVQSLQKLFYPMLAKTFEIGRVPVPDDFLNDCCNEGCGTH
jgi:cell fate (sporulation/competence/biofilm development) regulator YlbF (YheA/YmcA/DUF963 family)